MGFLVWSIRNIATKRRLSAGLNRRNTLENLRARFDSEEERDDRPHEGEQAEHHKDRIDAPGRQNQSDDRCADHRCAPLPCAGDAAPQRAQMRWVDFGRISRMSERLRKKNPVVATASVAAAVSCGRKAKEISGTQHPPRLSMSNGLRPITSMR